MKSSRWFLFTRAGINSLISSIIPGKVILFLTDGEPSPFTPTIGRNILKTVTRLNRQLDNQVVLLTYGMGKGTEAYAHV